LTVTVTTFVIITIFVIILQYCSVCFVIIIVIIVLHLFLSLSSSQTPNNSTSPLSRVATLAKASLDWRLVRVYVRGTAPEATNARQNILP
jgi:hypothetical protein